MAKKKAPEKPTVLTQLIRYDMDKDLSKCSICSRKKPSGHYSLNRYCCLARYLSILPAKQMRNNWITWLEQFYKNEVIQEIKTQTIEIMKARKP